MAVKKSASLTVLFPPELLERARNVGKLCGAVTGQMIRDGLVLRVEQLEQQRQRELEFKASQRALRAQENRGPGRPRKIGSSPLGPRPISSITDARRGYSPTGKIDDLYKALARSIVQAGNNAAEVRRRAEAAVDTIKREQPLLHPPEDEILALLEKYVRKVRDEVEELPRSMESFVSSMIDVSTAKTSDAVEE